MPRFFLLLLGSVFIFALSGCGGRQRRINWRPVLQRSATAPYGTSLIYKALPSLFPGAEINPLSRGFEYDRLAGEDIEAGNGKGRSLLIAVGLRYGLSYGEWEELKSWAAAGNDVLIFSADFDERVGEAFGHAVRGTDFLKTGEEEEPSTYYPSSSNQNILALTSQPGRTYGHNGRWLQRYFEADSGEAETEGAYNYDCDVEEYTSDNDASEESDEKLRATVTHLGTASGRPNFLRVRVRTGSISIHAAPLVLSNYFLLQPGNRRYTEGVFQTLPDNIRTVHWHEYGKRKGSSNPSDDSSPSNALWKYPAMRWAMLLAALTLLVYVLSEGKRRQRIIPIVRPPENASVAFAETIGRLYYNRGDHYNLAVKSTQHFLEWVRMRHNLPTTTLDDAFAEALARKSGLSLEAAREAAQTAATVRGGTFRPTDEAVHAMHRLYRRFAPDYPATPTSTTT